MRRHSFSYLLMLAATSSGALSGAVPAKAAPSPAEVPAVRAAAALPTDQSSAVLAPGLTIFGEKGRRINPDRYPATRVYAEQWKTVYARLFQMKAGSGGIAEELMPAPVRRQWDNLRKQYAGTDAHKRLRVVNGFFNSWSGISDEKNYGRKEYWACPTEFLLKGGGDCEDYALAKYFVLRELGWPEKDLWLVLLRDMSRREDHAVLAVRLDEHMLILDNLSHPGYLVMPDDTYKNMYKPYLAINADGFWLFAQKKTKGEASR